MKKLILWCFVIVACNTMVFAGTRYYSNSDNPIPLSQAKGFMQNRSIGFEENKGQVTGDDANRVKFILKDDNLSLFLLNDGIAYQFNRIHYPEGYSNTNLNESVEQQQKRIDLSKDIRIETYRMDVQLVGANPNPRITTDGESKDYVQYYTHNALNVHNYSKVTYHDIYPNIDWVIYSKDGQVKYDFIVRPGGNPDQIKLASNWVEDLKLNEDGSITMKNRMGVITEKAPISFQGSRDIKTHFVVKNGIIGFNLGDYSKEEVILIDPALIWSTYFGGSASDQTLSCTTDSGGNLYFSGISNSFNISLASGGYQNTKSGANDAYLAKFTSSGVLIWATYYGDSGNDDGRACVVDSNGDVYLAGLTTSASNIALSGHQMTSGSASFNDCYIVKFNSSGVRLWATYYGGSMTETMSFNSLAIDNNNDLYMVGNTPSLSGIASGGFQNTMAGNQDGFLVKFNTNGTRLWATYYGSTDTDDARGCFTDASGNVYIVGASRYGSGLASGGHQNVSGGGEYEAYLVKFNSSGLRQWATYYGGTGNDYFLSGLVDGAGDLYVIGNTSSTANIAVGGYQNIYGGGTNDAMIIKFNTAGVRQWGTYFGGLYNDEGRACAIDQNGNVFFVGSTTSNTGVAFNGFINTAQGGSDAFLLKITTSGTPLWATYFGGSQTDEGFSCAFDNTNGKVYMAGRTTSTSGIAYLGHQNTFGGNSATGAGDGFVAQFDGVCNYVPAPTGTNPQTLCDPSTIDDLTATGTSIQWYSTSTGGAPLPTGSILTSGTYYASQTVAGCESIDRFSVSANVITNPAAPAGNATQMFCLGATVSDLIAVGTNIQWYDVPSGGTPLANGTVLFNGTTYYATQTNSCTLESTTRLSVQVTIDNCQNSLDFDGLNDRVDLPASTHSQITTSGTLEGWIRTSANNSGYRAILVRSNYYGLFLVDNKLSTYVWGGGAPTGVTTYNGATLNDGQWHHVALSFQVGVTNGTQMYLDGQPVGPAITLTTLSTANNFQIGSNTTQQFFIGNLDEVKIWSRSLTLQEISDSYNCLATGSTSLRAHYDFNEGFPAQTNAGVTTLQDLSGLNNNGTLFNFGLTGSTSNWVSGYTCAPNLCPTPAGFANQTLCAGSTVADLTANGQNIQWYSASTGGTLLDPSTLLVNGNIYYATQTTADCESSARLAVTVTLNALPSAPTGAGSQNACAGTVANLTATGTNLQWYDVTTGGTPLASSTLLTNGATYFASQTVSGCESTDRLAVVVTTETPPPTGNASQEICTGGGTVTVNSLSATGSNIKWYANPSGGTFLPSNTPLVNGTTYYASQTINGCESINRLAVTVTLHNFTSNVTAPNPQSFCGGATIADLVANITPGATLNWYTTSTGWAFGTPLPTSTVLNNNTTYYAGQSLGSTNQCVYAGSFGVTVSLNSTSTPTGSATQTFCNSATVANLSATGTAIQWYTTSTGGTALSSGTSLTNGTTYYASQTVSGCESASRLEVTVTINAPSVPTGIATQTFCSGATVGLLSANGTNIQWYNTSTGGSPIQTTTVLQDGLIYYASQTIDGCESVGRLEVTAAFGIPSAPTGLAIQTFCNSATVANLLASGSNIQWYANPTGGATLSNSAPLSNGSTYYATQTSGGCESTDRLPVNVTINVPAAPIGNTLQEFCNSAAVASLAATGTDVQWYTSSTGGTALSAGTVISNATTYYASQTISGCESAIRLEVAVTINTPSAPTGAATQSLCGSATLADLTVTGTTLLWYDAASAGNTLSTSLNVSSGATYYVSQTINGCESIDRLAVQVTINSIPSAPTGSAAQSFCNAGTVSDLAANESGTQWYTTPSGGTPLATSTALANGASYYATQTINGCESTDRFAVTVTINSPAAPTGSATQQFCNTGTVAELISVGSDIQWYTTSTGGSALDLTAALVNGTYYASQTISGCESADRFVVAVTINIPTAPAGNTNQNFCGSALVSDIAISGSNITWYDAASAGNVLLPTTALADGSTYYANQTISGCESLNQLAVTVSVNAIPSAPTGAATQEFCNGATIAELAVTGTALTWYASAVSSAPLSSSTSMSNGTTYFATQTLNGCESSDRLEVTVTINAPVAPSGNPTQTFCSAATVNDLNATGTDVAWYSTATGGTPLASSAALSNGTYYASQTINGCESANRLAVAVTVTILNANVTQSGITLTAAQSGANYTWVDCNNGNQPIAGASGQSYTPTANGSYAVEIDLNGCSTMSSCVQITTVGLEEDKVEMLNIEPNPTSGMLIITVSQPTDAVVTASNGTIITTLKLEGETVLDATKYATGVYYLRTSEGQTVKFIKE